MKEIAQTAFTFLGLSLPSKLTKVIATAKTPHVNIKKWKAKKRKNHLGVEGS